MCTVSPSNSWRLAPCQLLDWLSGHKSMPFPNLNNLGI